MTEINEDVRTVDGLLTLDKTMMLVRCPCGYSHEHDVTAPEDVWTFPDPTDFGVHTSKCADSPRIRYRILFDGWLGRDERVRDCQLNLAKAKAACRRERQEERAAQRFHLWQQRALEQHAKRLKRLEKARTEPMAYGGPTAPPS